MNKPLAWSAVEIENAQNLIELYRYRYEIEQRNNRALRDRSAIAIAASTAVFSYLGSSFSPSNEAGWILYGVALLIMSLQGAATLWIVMPYDSRGPIKGEVRDNLFNAVFVDREDHLSSVIQTWHECIEAEIKAGEGMQGVYHYLLVSSLSVPLLCGFASLVS